IRRLSKTMEQRISLITLGVASIARSRAFYEALGWKASAISNESVTFFQTGGVIIGLFGRGPPPAGAGVFPGGSRRFGVLRWRKMSPARRWWMERWRRR